MSPIDTFEQDLRDDLQAATSYAESSLPFLDVTDVVTRGARVVRRRRIVAGVGALAVVAAVVLGTTAAMAGLDSRADLRPGQTSSGQAAPFSSPGPSGVVATVSGAVAIDKVPLSKGSSQGMRADFWSGTREGVAVVAVRLTPSFGAPQTFVFSRADIAAGRAVAWFDKHTAIGLAPDESLAMLETRTTEPDVSGALGLTGTDVAIVVRPFSASMDTTQPVGLVWKDHDGNGVGSTQLAIQSMKVSVLGRTDGCWASAVINMAGCYFATGATEQVWHKAGLLPSMREDDIVNPTSILVVEVPAKDGITFMADPSKPAQNTYRPVSVERHGSAWWAAFEVPTRFLGAQSTVAWTATDGSPGSGLVH